MAEKEATVYIVDLSSSMGRRNSGRNESDFEWAMRYVWDKITTTVFPSHSNRPPKDGNRTRSLRDERQLQLGFSACVQTVIFLKPTCIRILLPDLRELQNKLHVSNTDSGDAISALVVAIQMISGYCRKLKYKRKIILVTNGTGYMDGDDLDHIAEKLATDGIELCILGVDFDDPEYGIKEEGKPSLKAANEATLKTLTEKCEGVYGTLEQAISELGIPRLKIVRPWPLYKGQLTLGDPETYSSALSIDVERYSRTMVAKAPSASNFVGRVEIAPGDASTQSSTTIRADDDLRHGTAGASNLTSVKNARTYQVDDESAPGGKRDVDREELARGYEYGRTAVHISETEENVTKLETYSGFEILGFVPWDRYERYMNMSTSSIIVAQKTNDKASMALSSLVHALFELDSYAIARLVTRDNKSPILVLLAPSIEADFECLHDVQLPFAEDLRSYKFPPLDKIVTVSGKVLSEHRNLPTDQLTSAMSDYVDHMDLSDFGRDDDGQPAEYMQMEDTFSPVLHRIDQAVRWRAIHPTEAIPPPYEILTKYSQPPPELVQNAKSQLESLKSTADVKKVPPKLQSRRNRNRRPQPAPLSGLDVTSLLSRERPAQASNAGTTTSMISAENAIPEFKQLLATTEDTNTITTAVEQMSAIIEDQITHSLGDGAYDLAFEEMCVMREELIELEEPELWNEFVKGFKRKLLEGSLGGDRREMWWKIRKSKVGLVTKGLCQVSEIGDDEAKA
ncbi:MAG: ATP-dependent DNA helicase II subunit 2, partial [Sclerophora amabilis]